MIVVVIFFLGDSERSRFQGVFSYEEKRMLKLIDWIGSSRTPKKIIHKGWCCEKVFDETDNSLQEQSKEELKVVSGESSGRNLSEYSERLVFPKKRNGFYFISEKEKFIVDLDIRESYDLRDFGRYHSIEVKKDFVVVEYIKKKSDEEGVVELKFYVVIGGEALNFEKQESWIKKEYSYDRRRGSFPDSRFVFRLGEFSCRDAVVCWGNTREKVVNECLDMVKNQDEVIRLHKEECENVVSSVGSFCCENPVKAQDNAQDSTFEIKTAYKCAELSLRGLSLKDGIFAGFPWFFQEWSRDELISLGGIKDNVLKKNILKKYAENILPDGRLPNILDGKGFGSADSIGWFFLRVEEMFSFFDEVEFSDSEKDFFIQKLKYSFDLIVKHFVRDGLVWNSMQETWMDTKFERDAREGNRIEIQAMMLRMYKFMSGFFSELKQKEEGIKEAVLREFWDGKCLKDGKGDETIRPNIFIAAYFYPELLSREEWTECFIVALESLWLDWGGLSTIDKKNPLFCRSHTGEDNRSYHRGDSWFWLNNLAAIIMARVDRERFSGYIDKIISASVQDILFSGCIGCASEISSAEKIDSFGCYNQAWSNALFIEMVDELKGKLCKN